MNRSKVLKFITLICVLFVVLLAGANYVKAESVETTILTEKGEIQPEKTREYYFVNTVKSKIFYYFDGSENNISANYEFSIVNDKGEEVYKKEKAYYYVSKYVGKKLIFETELDKGEYKLRITNCEKYYTEQYKFHLNFSPIEIVEATSIKISESNIVLNKNAEFKINSELQPQYTTENIVWKSSNTKIATVSQDGTITAKSDGKCEIIASVKNLSQKCNVTVKTGSSKGTVVLSKEGIIYNNKSKTFKFKVPVEAAVEVKFKYYTYGKCRITIDDFTTTSEMKIKDATIKAPKIFKPGEYKITLQEINNYNFDYNMDVIIKPTSNIKVKSVKLNKTSKTMKIGEKYTLKPSINPVYNTEKTIKWKSSNKKVATVDSKGVVKAKTMGETTITVTTGKKSAKCKIKVTSANINLWKGDSLSLTKYVKNISKYKKGKWSTDNKKKVTVSSAGKIKTKKDGNTTLTFKVGKTKYKFKVYVYNMNTINKNSTNKLKYLLKNPQSLIKNHVDYYTYNDKSGVYVIIDYSAMNGFGGYNRSKFYYYCSNGKYSYYTPK